MRKKARLLKVRKLQKLCRVYKHFWCGVEKTIFNIFDSTSVEAHFVYRRISIFLFNAMTPEQDNTIILYHINLARLTH